MSDRPAKIQPFCSWRALARRDDGTEQLLTVGNSSKAVRGTYSDYFREELEDDERIHVVSIVLQAWAGDANRGEWVDKTELRVPDIETRKIHLAVREPVDLPESDWKPPVEIPSPRPLPSFAVDVRPARIPFASRTQSPGEPREPTIGICVGFTAVEVTSPDTAENRCAAAVRKVGGIPSTFPQHSDPSALDDWLRVLDGLILVGDDPSVEQSIHPVRDERVDYPGNPFESRWLRLRPAFERSIPILAIGDALSFLNAQAGGTSIRHIPTEVRGALPHFERSRGPHRHMVRFELNTLLADLYGVEELRVNSAHFRAVRSVAAGYRVAARAPDGIIEAIESVDPTRFCVGVQWHPEEETASALDGQLFDSLIRAALGPMGHFFDGPHFRSIHFAG